MKKLFPLFLFVAFSITAEAQTSFSLITPACHNDGVLSATFTGLTPPLTVRWYTQGSTGTIIQHTGVAGLTDVLTGYSGGPMTVSATDVTGASDTGVYAGAPPFIICPVSVAGGTCPLPDTLTASVCSGGTAPFHYTWYNIGTSGIVGTMNPTPVHAGDIYGVTVTDAAGCTYGSLVDPLQVYAYTIPNFADSITVTTAACTNGTATAHPYAGGVPPFTYLWSTGATTPTISSLVTGIYYLTVTDAQGCTYSDLAFVPQAIGLSVPVVPTPTACSSTDGSVIAFATGGTAPYSYLWSNGATGNSQNKLSSGLYTVNVTDANGCIGSGSAFVGASTPIAVTYTTTPTLCTTPTGTAAITVSGGTFPYSTQWYTTPSQTGNVATALTSGIYTFKVTDATGCTQTGTIYVPPIDVISASFLATPATCTLANGSVTVYPTGGVAPYTYLWSTGTGGATLSTRAAGNYSVTITDNVGCKYTKELYLPFTSPVGISAMAIDATCVYANDGMNAAYAWGGTPPYSYGWSTGGTTNIISALPAGPYWVHATDAAGCTTFPYYSYVGYDTTATSCYCTIDGTVYNDINDNCTQDPGEAGLPNMQIHITGGATNIYTYTDANGYYNYKVPAGSYTVSQTMMPHYTLQSCQLNNVHVTAGSGGGCVNTINFADSVDTVHDIHISTWDYLNRGPVPGHMYSQVTIVANEGSVAEDSILVTYRADGQLFAPSFVAGGYFSGAANYYMTDSFTMLSPGQNKQFFMNYTVPTNIPLNTNIVFRDTAAYLHPTSNWTTDNTPWNNLNYFTTTTQNSMEPNFKEVSPRGTGSAGIISYTDSVLEYMVHFQNTGDYLAENVEIIDTLDDNLNWATLRPVFQSAPCKVTVMQSGVKKVVKFSFMNINLPPSANDAIRSNGMVTYTVHIKPGLATGSQIRNRAAIYFDRHAPVVTNTTLNTIGTTAPNEVANHAGQGVNNTFNIYPNPASRTFNAVISSDINVSGTIKIEDITGRTMTTRTINVAKGQQTIAMDASQLAAGTYFVTFSNGLAVQTQKLVIMK